MTDAELSEHTAEVTRLLEQRGARRERNELRFPCPQPEHHANGDTHWSARWHPDKGVWRCDVSGMGGGALNLRWLLNMDQRASWNGARSPSLSPPGTGDRTPRHDASDSQRETGRWTIRTPGGEYCAEHIRLEPGRNGRSKDCVWERHGERGLGSRRLSDLPLYGVHELAQGAGGSPVVLVEGEKARDALSQRGVRAVGTVTGASGTPSDGVLRSLAGAEVVLWPDA